MDKIMAFLQEKIGGFFTWVQKVTKLPTKKYGNVSVNWSIVAFMVLVWAAMFLLLPGGLIFD